MIDIFNGEKFRNFLKFTISLHLGNFFLNISYRDRIKTENQNFGKFLARQFNQHIQNSIFLILLRSYIDCASPTDKKLKFVS